MRKRGFGGCLVLWLGLGCGAGDDSLSKEWYDDGSYCGGYYCEAGFHCEFEACVPDTPPPAPPPPPGRSDPLASGRYVFVLERDQKRLVRIDSQSLAIETLTAGLLPMELGVIGSRELTVLLDGQDLVEVLDHRSEPPRSAAFTTARALSHLALSPSGEHAIAYFDWDDSRAQERQPEPGNINQVSVVFVGDGESPMSDADARVIDVAVGFLPRDVRFSADGTRAVVVAKETLTPIDLLGLGEVALVQPGVRFDAAAKEIVIDASARFGMARYEADPRIDILDLATGETTCFVAPGPVYDIALDAEQRLLIVSGESDRRLILTSLAEAGATCTALAGGIPLGWATTLALEPHGRASIAYVPRIDVESVWVVDAATETATEVLIDKAVSGVAFVGDGEYALLSHMKASGDPAWDPSVEAPEVSVDKAYGVSWLSLATRENRLAVSDAPFGTFAFVTPALDASATFLAVQDELRPQLLRVEHAPGFDDAWIDLAAPPLMLGYLPATTRAYVTQDHPWGRVTFLDPSGTDLRHVTGFAMGDN